MDPEGVLLVGAFLTPQFIEDSIGGYDLISIDQEQRQKRFLFVASQVDGLVVASELDWPEDTELNTATGHSHLQPEPCDYMSSDLSPA
jgi:hypothetical protein